MKRSVQEVVELVVFGAIALLIGTGVLWLAGWIFTGLGWLSLAVSGLIWRVLIVLVPIVIVAGLVYWLATRLLQQRQAQPAPAAAAATVSEPAPAGQSGPAADAAPAEEPALPFDGQESPAAEAAGASAEPAADALAEDPPAQTQAAETEDPDEWPLRNG